MNDVRPMPANPRNTHSPASPNTPLLCWRATRWTRGGRAPRRPSGDRGDLKINRALAVRLTHIKQRGDGGWGRGAGRFPENLGGEVISILNVYQSPLAMPLTARGAGVTLNSFNTSALP